ncbi:hypothetical protein DPMN_153336 [Dreissena polymorpha]|uniref:Uncharacterized protein n=1 Tax=Dreissena polymorpha TaxID=45954 RepID=A0A9D4FM59_DREPO|nr:hypothetical protein DPMN_153336 [Dreissena polymorpha]
MVIVIHGEAATSVVEEGDIAGRVIRVCLVTERKSVEAVTNIATMVPNIQMAIVIVRAGGPEDVAKVSRFSSFGKRAIRDTLHAFMSYRNFRTKRLCVNFLNMF